MWIQPSARLIRSWLASHEAGQFSGTGVLEAAIREIGRLTRLPEISNNVGSVKSFVDRLLYPLRRVFSFFRFLWPSVDNHGSPVNFRSVSARPTHLFDPSFRP